MSEEYSAFQMRNDPEAEIRRLELDGLYKLWCRRDVAYALKRGYIKKEPCVVCGVAKVQAHHEDYSQPLRIKWVCPKHHGELDAKRRRVAQNKFLPDKKQYQFPSWNKMKKL